jgi:hypothetical protein
MIKGKKACYTLNKKVLDLIAEKSTLEKKSKSEYLADCIKTGYEMMLEDFHENNEKPYNYTGKRRKNTIAKTFTLQLDIVNELDWFSKKLGIKKSHLVVCCVLDAARKESEECKITEEHKTTEELIDDLYVWLHENLLK